MFAQTEISGSNPRVRRFTPLFRQISENFLRESPSLGDLISDISEIYPRSNKPENKMVNTVWTKEANEFLVSEVAIGHPVRICNYAKIGHGQKNAFWDGVAAALKERTETFLGNSFPSGKTCLTQFEKLLTIQKANKKDHKWKSGGTEDIGEIASGLEEIIAEMEEEADHADLDREAKEGVVALSAAQDLELTKGRVTPKANKKPFVRPTPDGEPITQKDTLDSMLIKVLSKKADEDTSVDRDRKHSLEDRKMLLREEEFQEAKRVRQEAVEEARLILQEAREDSIRRDEMSKAMLKIAMESLAKK